MICSVKSGAASETKTLVRPGTKVVSTELKKHIPKAVYVHLYTTIFSTSKETKTSGEKHAVRITFILSRAVFQKDRARVAALVWGLSPGC